MIKKLSIILLGLLLTNILSCQNIDSLRVRQIDSLISLIPTEIKGDNYYSITQGGGVIEKKILGLFTKRIGGFSTCIINHDTLIFSVCNVHSYNANCKSLSETFYYQNNQLIKYIRKLTVHPNLLTSDILLHQVVAYFDNERLIKQKEKIADNYLFTPTEQQKVTKTAKTEISLNISSIKQLYNFAPVPTSIRTRQNKRE